MIIDGIALVRAMGKPPNATTFGDYADAFTKKVKSNLHHNITRVDILFDRYHRNSIKTGTRVKWQHYPTQGSHNNNKQLPTNWNSSIEMDENKSNLTQFLSDELERQVRPDGQ